MKIEKIEITPAVMPKEDPLWRFALAGSPESRGCVVTIHTDESITGIGYGTEVRHLGITFDGVLAALEIFGEVLKGKNPFDIESCLSLMDRALVGHQQAKAAVDIALHDLKAKALHIPLYQLLGGLVREEIPILRILALKESDEMASNAARLVEQGYTYLKIKVDGNVAKDVQRVKAIRKAAGDGIHLTVDANQSYTPKAAIQALKRMEEFGVELAEQPVRADDWRGLAQVAEAVDCLVEADESAQTLPQVFMLVSQGIVDSISIKVHKLGGFRRAKMAADICKAGNVQCRVGASVGSRILAAAGMHFVASTENIGYACELGEFARLLNDPAEGLEVEKGKLRVPSGEGLGVQHRSVAERHAARS